MTTDHYGLPTGKQFKRWVYTAMAVPMICIVLLLVVLTGCGNNADQDACRATARQVFTAVYTDRMTQQEGQARVDQACKGLDATERKAILDAERIAVMARDTSE